MGGRWALRFCSRPPALPARFLSMIKSVCVARALQGLFLSMCISNVTAPILLLSVVLPILHELPSSSAYARALLFGLAFSCNLGGMLTPISSPQNAVPATWRSNARRS